MRLRYSAKLFDTFGDAFGDFALRQQGKLFAARAVDEGHLVRVAAEAGSGVAQRVEDDEVEILLFEFGFGVRLFVVGFQGESHQQAAVLVRSKLGGDVARAAQGDAHVAVAFLDFGVRNPVRGCSGHGASRPRRTLQKARTAVS